MCGRWRGAQARARWCDWDLGNCTSTLRKAIGEKLKFSGCRKSNRKQMRPSCIKTSDEILCLFGFMKAMKFRDSSEFLECVQNVLAKSCLRPLKFFCGERKAQKDAWYWPKDWARPLGTKMSPVPQRISGLREYLTSEHYSVAGHVYTFVYWSWF